MRLPYVVEVQEREEQRDADGGVTEHWRTVATRHADVENFAADEQVQGAAVAALVRCRVTMRNGGPALSSKQRLLFKGRQLRILGIVREERKPGKQVATCVEVENDG